MMPSRLFVYGTLRRDNGDAIHSLLQKRARLVGDGTVGGQLFDLGEYPGLVLSPSASEKVYGEVYELDPSVLEVTIRALDDYEGIGSADPQPQEYRREAVRVNMDDGSTLEAWAYVLSSVPNGCTRIPGNYLEWRESRLINR
jgi:gamma-glutamylcyclotransferase (GGCT)/AIG2-like uncharacterized protein YtfP